MNPSLLAEQTERKTDAADRVRALERAGDMEGLRSFWEAHEAHPNNDLDYFLLIARTRKEVVAPLVLTVESDSQIKASLAGRIEETRQRFQIGYLNCGSVRVRKLSFITGGAVGDLSPVNARLLIDWVRTGLKERGLDFAVLHKQPPSSALALEAGSAVPALLREHGGRETDHWRISLPADYNEFLGRRKKSHRRHFTGLFRILERDFPGKVEMRSFDSPETVEQFCRDAEVVASRTYQRKLGAGFADTAENREYCRLLAARGAMKGYILYLNERPCAFWLASTHGEFLFPQATGYDPEFRKYEVGTVMLLNQIRAACGTVLKTLDFGLGGADYKERFGDERWLEKDCYIFAPTFRGVVLNLAISGVTIVENAARWLVSLTGPVHRIKTMWRRRLLAKQPATPPENP